MSTVTFRHLYFLLGSFLTACLSEGEPAPCEAHVKFDVYTDVQPRNCELTATAGEEPLDVLCGVQFWGCRCTVRFGVDIHYEKFLAVPELSISSPEGERLASHRLNVGCGTTLPSINLHGSGGGGAGGGWP